MMKKRTILLPLLALTMIGSTMLYAKKVEREDIAHTVRKDKTVKTRDAGWYMRTRVSATAEDGTVYAHNTAGVFGELKQSRKKKDRHDIPAFGAATLQVVFPHYNWAEGEAGDYWSDYRKYNKRRAGRRAVWTFQVKNQKNVDLSNAELKIALDDAVLVSYTRENGSVRYRETGVDKEMKNRFTLVDVDNKRTYRVDELEDAGLSMDGKHTRTFRWVRGPVKKRDFRPVVMPEE
jgi:hypothetical protein